MNHNSEHGSQNFSKIIFITVPDNIVLYVEMKIYLTFMFSLGGTDT